MGFLEPYAAGNTCRLAEHGFDVSLGPCCVSSVLAADGITSRAGGDMGDESSTGRVDAVLHGAEDIRVLRLITYRRVSDLV